MEQKFLCAQYNNYIDSLDTKELTYELDYQGNKCR